MCSALADPDLRIPAPRPVLADEHHTIDLTAHELHRAVDDHEFVLHYQPLINLHDGRLEGAEGLLRWRHPHAGTLPAGVFIEHAVDVGAVTRLMPQILDDACRTATMLRAQAADAYVAVNVDPHQLTDEPVVDLVQSALSANGADAGSLVIEMTERTDVIDQPAAIDTARELRALGVQIAIDDFGTGHSSLSRVKHFPAGKLKIDRSFVRDVVTDRDDQAIVASVIMLAERLGLTCVAEGIESEQQAALLADLGCACGQGFLWSEAVGSPGELRRCASRKPSAVLTSLSAPRAS